MIRDYEELQWFIIKNRSYDHEVRYLVYYDGEWWLCIDMFASIQTKTERGFKLLRNVDIEPLCESMQINTRASLCWWNVYEETNLIQRAWEESSRQFLALFTQ
ncbi:uncharacterized protein LOC118507356 [Anopheles stephensi]|uniref:uncharacterized protein LOC118507356 n=1 Tax=Anopheles stephensi TaxID=30069 RepID=UPI001658AB36|nr:uncharacterized protein LOC118507356 [Anopheles stephensi]